MAEFIGEQPPDNNEMTNGPEQKSEAEFRAEQAQKVIKFLKRAHVYDYVKDISSGEEKMPDFKEFKDFLVRLNGIAREIPISERKPDGENVRLSGFIGGALVPKHSDKEELLKYAYESIPNIKKEDVKYLLPAMVNAVHLFADGNGRTSRILHQLLTEYPSEKEFLNETEGALGEHGRYDSLDINPGLIGTEIELETLKNHGWAFTEPFVGQLDKNNFEFAGAELRQMDKDVPKEAKEVFRLYENGRGYALTAIHMLLGDERVKKLFTDKYKKANPQNLISPFKMMKILTEDDWQKIHDNFFTF